MFGTVIVDYSLLKRYVGFHVSFKDVASSRLLYTRALPFHNLFGFQGVVLRFFSFYNLSASASVP